MGRRKDHRPGGKRYTDKAIRTSDGFDNVGAHLGLGQDNLLAMSGYKPGSLITRDRVQLNDMYRTSWIVGRAVDVVPADMTRARFEIQGSLDQPDQSSLYAAFRNRGIFSGMASNLKWARLYGGSIAIILVDGHDMRTPLRYDDIQKGSFRGLHILDRHHVTPSLECVTDLGPFLGYPKYYKILFGADLGGLDIHYSRVLRNIGIELPRDEADKEESWGASIVERGYDRILALDSATYGASSLLFKSFLRTIGVSNLREILAAGGKAETALNKMFSMIRRMQSTEGLTVMDSKDTFATHGASFAGLYDALQAFSEQIGGAFGIPMIRLLGQSSKGFASGEYDLKTYYDSVLTSCNEDLSQDYIILSNVLSRNLWGRSLPEEFDIDFQSLYEPTEPEKGQIGTADAQNVAGLYNAGIITKSQALSELRDASRVSGRFSGITDEDIAAAEKDDAAPSLPEGFLPDFSGAT